MTDAEGNRRETFRLDDTMQVHVCAISPDEVDDILADFESFRIQYSIGSYLKLRKEALLPQLIVIRKNDPDVAQYLEHLEGLLQLLATRLPTDHEDVPVRRRTLKAVNLSSKGLRFTTTEPFAEGQMVELGMRLSSSNTEIIIIATVKRIEDVPGDQSESGNEKLLSFEFTHVHPDDNEAIIRHMAKLQQLQLQARRNTQEEG